MANGTFRGISKIGIARETQEQDKGNRHLEQ